MHVCFHQRLLAFYQDSNTENVGDVTYVLAKYQDKEAKLFDALIKRYGPESGDSDDEDHVHHEEEEEEEEEEATSDDDGQPKLRNVVYCPIDTFPS